MHTVWEMQVTSFLFEGSVNPSAPTFIGDAIWGTPGFILQDLILSRKFLQTTNGKNKRQKPNRFV
jgi:hypothetical protein